MAMPRHVTERSPALLSAIELLDSTTKEPKREFCVFKAGTNMSRKGPWEFSMRSAMACQQAHREFAGNIVRPYAVDWAHGAWNVMSPNPQLAGKAAGWCSMEVRNGELWVTDCEYMPDAKAAILAGEWRFFSPTFDYDMDTREVLAFLGGGMTNIPALHNPPELAHANEPGHDTKEKRSMKALLAALGLDPNLSEEEAIKAVMKKMNEGSVPPELLSMLGATNGTDALGKLKGVLQNAEGAKSAQEQLAALKASQQARELDDLIAKGKAELKIAPAQESYWRDQAKTYGNQILSSFLATAVPIVPGGAPGAQSPGPGAPTGPSAEVATLDSTEVRVAMLMAPKNKKPEEFVAEVAREKARLNGRPIVKA